MDCVNRDMRAIGATEDEVHDRTDDGRMCPVKRSKNKEGKYHKNKNNYAVSFATAQTMAIEIP